MAKGDGRKLWVMNKFTRTYEGDHVTILSAKFIRTRETEASFEEIK